MNTISHETIKRAPYSEYLRAALNHPENWPQYAGTSADCSAVSVFLLVGSESWNKARNLENTHLFALLPPGDDPFLYDWRVLAGHDPIVAIVEGQPPSEKDFYNLASALIRDGIKRFTRPDKDGRCIRHLSEEVIKCTA